MKRRTVQVAAALAASAALLTACGSDDEPENKTPIKGAGRGGGEASASPSTSVKPGGDKRPDIKLPESFQVNFEGWKNSDPKLQAIMDDSKGLFLATHAAIINADPQYGAFTFYSESDARRTGTTWIKGFVDRHHTLIGKARVFQPQPRLSPDGSGTLFYCVDESKASTKDTKTGEVTATPADDALVLYRTKLRKTAEDVWKTTMVQTERGACK